MISMDKKYQTRDGRPVRLLCTDAPGPWPVKAIVGDETSVRDWSVDGKKLPRGTSPLDLIEVPPPKRSGTVSVYPDGLLGFDTKTEADCWHLSNAKLDRLACVEWTEGDGL